MVLNGMAAVYQDWANYSCDPGWEFPGGLTFIETQCNSSGLWSVDKPNCQSELHTHCTNDSGSPVYIVSHMFISFLKEATWSNFLSMKRQWTYGPTLLPWNNHFHTSEACLKPL